MGTSTDSTGRQESDSITTVIPWSCVNYCIINKLVQRLNPSSPFGDDWKGLAARLGYSLVNIAAIESEKKNNTEELFKDYARNPRASFNEVFTSLQEMKREDCMEVLENHFEEIKRAYHQQRQQPSPSSFHLSGGEMHSPSSGHNWSSHPSPFYMCGGISQRMGGPHCSPHPCYSFSHSCSGTHHDHCSLQAHQHAMPGFPSMAHIAHPQKPVHYDCSLASAYMPSHLQMNVQIDEGPLRNHGMNSTNSQYRNGFNERFISSPYGRPPLSMMSQNPESGHRVQTSVSDFGHLQSGLPGNSHQECVSEMSLHNIYPQKVYSERAPSEEIASHSQSAALNHYPFNNLPRNINPRDNSNLVSINSSNMSHSSNSWQQMPASLNQSQTSLLASNAAAAFSPLNIPQHQDPKDLDSKGSMAKLVHISKFPKQYQPTAEYTRVVAEQKIEEKKSNKSGKNNNDRHAPSISSGSSSGSSKSSGSRSGATASENANTYPLRAKIQPYDMAKDFASISIKKSASLPQSYKPKKFGKVHSTRLFVTYSSDSEEHKADILRLCVFLKENHFKSFVDVKSMPQSEENGNKDDCISRFEAADHVLICISPKYLEDTSTTNPPASNERQLHTHQIYKWMHEEHLKNLQNEQARQRAVILLFDSVGCDALPDWMKKYPTYKWPAEYEDLFWMLMKPEDKIKARCSGASL